MRSSYDGEIGRGRRTGNDSSSSRESSLGRPAPKRPFSPVGSDSGEPSLPVESTPVTHSPPPDRPLIRQAVAFASDIPPQNIETYEATPAPAEAVRFLPGQEVPPPTKKKTKRVKKGDLFSAQTSKFRIDTYDPTPSTQPPIAHGNGPYSSLYRGTPAPPKASRKASPATTATSSTYAATSSTASSNPPSVYAPPYGVSSVPTRPLQPPQPPPPAGIGSPSVASTRAGPARFAQMDGRPPDQNNYFANYPPPPGPNSSGSQTPSYYRHDYERGTWGSEHSRSSRRSNRRSTDPSHESNPARHQNRDSGRSNANSESAHRSKYPLRMLTLLIQDTRSGTIDHQLAEVKVPLRLADEAGSAYWADARDITEQLQRGPSRIDGPAKVYTPRGKYRQFILRVSRDNDDEFISANVAVAGDKTVDLVVELLNPPGLPPLPPQIPSGLLDSPSPYEDYEQENTTDHMEVTSQKQPDPPQDARKRANSASFDDYDGPDSPSPSKVTRHSYPSESVRHDSQRHRSLEGTTSSGPLPGGSESVLKEKRLYESIPATPPIPSSPRPSLEAEFMRILKEKVREFSGKGFADFFRSNAGTTLVDTLSQYEYFSSICQKFVGAKLDQFPHPIEEKHLVKLMKIDDPTFVNDCKETRRLMPLYGTAQSSRHDPQIAQMINTKFTDTKEHARKELLNLLYRSDNIWHNRPPDGPRPPANKSQASSADSTISSQGDLNPVARVNKSMFVE